MKTILVPVGSLEKGINTLQYAIDFAKHISAKVYVIKVYGVNKVAGSIKTVGNILAENCKKELKQLLEAVDQKNVDITASTMHGGLVDNIQLFIKNIDIDLIISASNRIAKDETVFIGNLTGSIINNVDCPIIVVPPTYKFKPIKTILMAIKSGVIKRDHILDPLSLLLKSFNAKLNLLQVITPNLQDEDLVINESLNALKSTFTTSENATIFQGVLEHLNQNNPDMICVIRRRKGFFMKLWQQNIVKKVDFESRIPLLVLRGAI